MLHQVYVCYNINIQINPAILTLTRTFVKGLCFLRVTFEIEDSVLESFALTANH